MKDESKAVTTSMESAYTGPLVGLKRPVHQHLYSVQQIPGGQPPTHPQA